jgi:uncharacterized membrane protein YedE/YeeE
MAWGCKPWELMLFVAMLFAAMVFAAMLFASMEWDVKWDVKTWEAKGGGGGLLH